MADPPLVSETVDPVLQAVLQGPGLEQGASSTPVGLRNDYLKVGGFFRLLTCGTLSVFFFRQVSQ